MKNDFDERAKTWDTPEKIALAQQIAHGIRRQVTLTADLRVLDYGCGTGLLSLALYRHVGPITLVDSSQGMLEVLVEKISAQDIKTMTPLHGDLATDRLWEKEFDLIYTAMTLHHIPNTADILDTFAGLLVPGGTLCIADLDAEDGSFHGTGFDGHRGFNRAALTQQLAGAGLKQISLEDCYTITKCCDNIERDYCVFLSVSRKGC